MTVGVIFDACDLFLKEHPPLPDSRGSVRGRGYDGCAVVRIAADLGFSVIPRNIPFSIRHLGT